MAIKAKQSVKITKRIRRKDGNANYRISSGESIHQYAKGPGSNLSQSTTYKYYKKIEPTQ